MLAAAANVLKFRPSYTMTGSQLEGRRMHKTLLNHLLRLSTLLLFTAAVAFAQAPKPQPVASEHPAPKFDIANIDKAADPCVDFYQYACGNWIKNNPIPGDQPVWLSFSEVYEHNLLVLRQILERAAQNDPGRSAVAQKIGDFYASCMDEAAANKAGAAPLKPELDRIAAIKDKTQMIEVMAHEQLIGPNPLLGFGSSPDLHNAEQTIALIDQSGLSLPDRDYYLKDDAPTLAIRRAFVDHMRKDFMLLGQSPVQAGQSAETVLKIETD